MASAESRNNENESVYLIIRHEKKTIMFYLRETDTIYKVKVSYFATFIKRSDILKFCFLSLSKM